MSQLLCKRKINYSIKQSSRLSKSTHTQQIPSDIVLGCENKICFIKVGDFYNEIGELDKREFSQLGRLDKKEYSETKLPNKTEYLPQMIIMSFSLKRRRVKPGNEDVRCCFQKKDTRTNFITCLTFWHKRLTYPRSGLLNVLCLEWRLVYFLEG